MRAFTVTIESASTVGKAVVQAASFNDAHNKAAKSCPPGFRVTDVLDNEREQKVSKFDMTEARLSRGLRSSHGHAADRCSLHARVNHSDHVAARGPKKGAAASKAALSSEKKVEKAAAKRTKARIKSDAASAKAEKKAAKEALADVLQELGLQPKKTAAKRGRPAKRRVKRRPAKRRAKKAE